MSGALLCFSIVLPCYNEAENLPPLLARYAEVWEDLPAELVLVNNGSTDDTARVLELELKRPDRAFARTIVVPVNRGYGYGIAAGLRETRGEFVGFSHADMQCSPADLFTAYHKLLAQPDPKGVVVKGKRSKRSLGPSIFTNIMGLLATIVLMTGLTDINAQPKVFHRSHLKLLTNPPNGFDFDLYVLYMARRAGLKVLTVPVIFSQRARGLSKWAFSFRSRWRTILATVLYIFRLRFSGI